MITVLAGGQFPRFAAFFDDLLHGWLRFGTPLPRAFASHSTHQPRVGTCWRGPLPEKKMQAHAEATHDSSGQADVLTFGPHALPPNLQSRTAVLAIRQETWWERFLRFCHLPQFAIRSAALRRAWALFFRAPSFKVVITTGTLDGLAFAFLQKLRGRRRAIHVMYDCLWYRGTPLKRLWMRACLQQVDCCVVWASVERARYASEFGVALDKFTFIPHHHSLLRYNFEIGDDGYIFTGGNSDRDYRTFLEALRDLPIPSILAITRPQLLAGLRVPAHVRVIGATSSEFRQLMARSRMVVVAMRANPLRTGGQQTFLNAMYMGKPVVLVDPEGGRDYIEHEKTGLLVPFGDAVSLRKAISYLWQNSEQARTLGERARDVAVPLTTERCNSEIWRIGLQLLREKNGPQETRRRV
jgi:glycosyltransferase involved in cell wall biosynthesis